MIELRTKLTQSLTGVEFDVMYESDSLVETRKMV